ncbi:MAG: diguanylate cyclase [Lautropia sp.]|nr:diguanylate cyclase [Lautropia sp.]
MRVFGLTLKPLAQWPRHALMITWSCCLLVLLVMALEQTGDSTARHEQTPLVLLVQSLALLPVIGLLHCTFLDPYAPQTAQLSQRSWLLRVVPPLAIVLSVAIAFLPELYARIDASVIVGILSLTLVSRAVATLRQHADAEGRLAAAAATVCMLVLVLSFVQTHWSLQLVPLNVLKAGAGLGLMSWVGATFLQAARRERALRQNLVQFDHAARALHRIYNTSPVALLSLDADSHIQRWNQRAADAFGPDLNRQPPPHIFALLGESVGQMLLSDLKKTGSHHSELTLSRNGQERVWVLEAAIRDGGGCEIGMHEVTAHARRAATFQEIAEHDTLTGLPNLVGLRRLLGKQLMQMRSSTPLSCIYVDIQEFNDINRVFGRHAGDAVLRAVSQHLQKLAPSPAVVGRVRDDHFLVILPGSELTLTRAQAGMLLESLTRTPIDHQGMSINIQVCIGAVESVASISADRLIESAQLACELSRAEAAPHPYAVMADSPALVDPDIQERFGKNLRNTLGDLQIRLHAKAVTSLKQDVPVHSLTVVPRLLASSGQLQSTSRLQKAAARQGASAALDRLLLTRILEAMNTQPWTLPANGVLIFRLNTLSLAEPGFTGNLIRLLGVQGDNRSMTINSRLCIELPSQTLEYDPEGSRAFLKDLRLMSVQSGIDLTDSEANEIPVRQLAQLPIRHVRLNGRQFADLSTSAAARKEITAIRALYETLGIQCLIDQVTNPLDLRPLRELGVDLVQGSAVSAIRPLEHVLAGREEQSLLPIGTLIPV